MKRKKLTSKMIGGDWYEAICPVCEDLLTSEIDGSQHIENGINAICSYCDIIYEYPKDKYLHFTFKYK